MKNFNNMKKTLCVIMALGTLLEASKAQTNSLTNGLVAYYPFKSNFDDQVRTNTASIAHNLVNGTNDPSFGPVIYINGNGGLSGNTGGYIEI